MSSRIIPQCILLSILILIPFWINAQSEKVIVGGGLQIGSIQDAPAVAGTIRWNPMTEDFEGYNGTDWVSLTFSPDQWGILENIVSENNFIVSDDPMANAQFGSSIDMDGDYIIIGEPGQQQAYIVKKSPVSWEIDTVLENISGSAQYGNHVAINGDYAMVSTADSVKVYMRSGTEWSLTVTLAPKDMPLTQNTIRSIDLQSDRAVIGMRAHFGIFERTGTTWTRTASIAQPVLNYNEEFGWAVAIYDTVAVVSAFLENSNKGAVYVYRKEMGTWNFIQKLLPTGVDGQYGVAVEIDKNRIYVGVKYGKNPTYPDRTGSVETYVYTTNWTKEDVIYPPIYIGDEFFGSSIDVDGSTLLVGAPQVGKGTAYFYKKIGSNWFYQAKFNATDGVNNDKIGSDTALSGSCALISGHEVDHQSLFNSGKVYMVRK
jgi:hypothetical protein